MSNIGELLKTYRWKRELGVRALAKEIGVSAATISRIERGNPMEQATMVKFIKWLFG